MCEREDEEESVQTLTYVYIREHRYVTDFLGLGPFYKTGLFRGPPLKMTTIPHSLIERPYLLNSFL